jgi:hypothetical protein
MKKIVTIFSIILLSVGLYAQEPTQIGAGGTWGAARGIINTNMTQTYDSLASLRLSTNLNYSFIESQADSLAAHLLRILALEDSIPALRADIGTGGSGEADSAVFATRYYVDTEIGEIEAGVVDSAVYATRYFTSQAYVPYTGATGSVALGANSLTLTGSIANTTNRVAKGWFTNLEVTNAPTINGTGIVATTQNIADSIDAYIATAEYGIALGDSTGTAEGNYLPRLSGVELIKDYAPVFADTIPLFVFGAGGGNESDTASFTTSTIYGSFYNSGSDSLRVTELRAVMVAGTTPLGTDTLSIQVYWNDSINVTGNGAIKLNTDPLGINSVTTGTIDTSFANTKIPPGVWVFAKSPGVVIGRKPKMLIIQLSGYKIPKY